MIAIYNARWNKPEGGESNTKNRVNYPVTHVSLLDAQIYCEWIGMRLPSEMEWEHAARGNLKEKLYPWGNEWFKELSNLKDESNDEYKGVSPVDAFSSQNLYEMHDMIGNVWEWTTTTYMDSFSQDKEEIYVLKGGSFLDSSNGTGNYKNMKIRISSRYPVRKSFTSQNIGFRCAQDIDYKIDGYKHNVVKLRAPILHDYHENNYKKIIKNEEL
jgi:formylglycine-generating enzyme